MGTVAFFYGRHLESADYFPLYQDLADGRLEMKPHNDFGMAT